MDSFGPNYIALLLRWMAATFLAVVVATDICDAETPKWKSLLPDDQLTEWRGRPHLDPRTSAGWTPEKQRTEQTAWDADLAHHWRVAPARGAEPAEIVSDGKGVFLTTRENYGDFEFAVEWKICEPNADSGIYLRGTPQVQIWDPDSPHSKQHGADRGSGGLWNNSDEEQGKWPLVRADRPVGEWNQMRIVMVGARIWVWLNEHPTVVGHPLENYWDRQLPIFKSGCIQLQTHGGEIRFRRPQVREITAAEAADWLRKREGNDFTSLFNGKDLSGWAGPLSGSRVEDGAIVSGNGTIYTEREFRDFDLIVEFMLPPAGNNGLAIRYPGDGDGAYEGMCELQVLDSEHPEYQGLDARQFHGSAYGLAAAARGFLRPVGEWNLQVVRVQGTRIIVELNGTEILDTDLSNVTEHMDGRPHPGLGRTAGHLGLCGHDSPVRYRRLEIREITK